MKRKKQDETTEAVEPGEKPDKVVVAEDGQEKPDEDAEVEE